MIKKQINKKLMVAFIAILMMASLATLVRAQDVQLIGSNLTTFGGNLTDPPEVENATDNLEVGNVDDLGQAVNAFQQNKIIMPGVPENAIIYNKTDITPKNQLEQVRAGEPAVFRYRNMTMLMNCTGNCNVIFSSEMDTTPKILGLSIEHEQNMTLTMNMYNSPPEGQKVAERTLNFYLGIEPSAQEQIKGQIRLYINQTELNNELSREVNASRLTWMFYNTTNSKWQAVPSFIDSNGYLICNTDHFSTWTAAEIDQTQSSYDGMINFDYVIVGVIAAVAVVVGVGVTIAFAKKKN